MSAQSPAAPEAGHAPPTAAPRELPVLRAAIDEVDSRLVLLLNERARLVVEVGARKRALTAIGVGVAPMGAAAKKH